MYPHIENLKRTPSFFLASATTWLRPAMLPGERLKTPPQSRDSHIAALGSESSIKAASLYGGKANCNAFQEQYQSVRCERSPDPAVFVPLTNAAKEGQSRENQLTMDTASQGLLQPEALPAQLTERHIGRGPKKRTGASKYDLVKVRSGFWVLVADACALACFRFSDDLPGCTALWVSNGSMETHNCFCMQVKVWLGEQLQHHYILSRFLICRMLTVTRIPLAKVKHSPASCTPRFKFEGMHAHIACGQLLTKATFCQTFCYVVAGHKDRPRVEEAAGGQQQAGYHTGEVGEGITSWLQSVQ
jgi:hypothetical protein